MPNSAGRPRSEQSIELQKARDREGALLDRWLAASTGKAPVTRYTRTAELYEDYTFWLGDNGTDQDQEYELSVIRFGFALKARKYWADKVSGNRVHRGILLKSDSD